MGLKNKGYLFLFGLILMLFLVIEYSKPKHVNWFQTYASHHKTPYGTFVFQHLLKDLHKDKMEQVNTPPYQILKNKKYSKNEAYVFINDHIDFDQATLFELVNWTKKGNTLFIASNTMPLNLLDTLHVTMSYIDGLNDLDIDPTYHFRLADTLASSTTYTWGRDKYQSYFKTFDTTKSDVLSYVDYKSTTKDSSRQYGNVLQYRLGKGKVVLSTFPEAFTNYFLLQNNNSDYTAGLVTTFSEAQVIYLDNHYKSGNVEHTSPMRVFLSHQSLQWAYYTFLIGALLYVFFEGKRKQRAIPIIKPLKNQTVAFTQVISNMYFENKNAYDITQHKINYFLEYIRSHFYINTQTIDTDFITRLAQKTKHSNQEIKMLFDQIAILQKKTSITPKELQHLNDTIEQFKTRIDGTK